MELIRRPREAAIVDYQVQADANGHIACSVDIRGKGSGGGTLSVKLYNDCQLSADGDEWCEGQCKWGSSKQIDLEMAGAVALSGLVSDVKLWSAESPFLYTLTVTLQNSSHIVVQSESCRVGFRTVDIQGGSLLVNGKAITFCGVNRHEHDPDTGKTVSLDRMKQDICLIK